MEDIDYNVINDALVTNSLALLKVIVVSYFIFYLIPSKVFPQDASKDILDRILYNSLYSLSFAILVIPQLVFFKLFNLAIYIMVVIAVKLFFIKYYEKRNLFDYFEEIKSNFMIKAFNLFDNYGTIVDEAKEKNRKSLRQYFSKLTPYKFFLRLFYFSLFLYAILNIGFSSLVNFGDSTPDNAYFVTWVTFLKENELWSDLNTFGAVMYGVAIFAFNLFIWTNLDSIIIFKVYPVLLIAFYFFGIYYVLYKLFVSRFTALFGILFLSLIFYSPLNQYFSGLEYMTTNPEIKTFFGLFSFFYVEPTVENIKIATMYSSIPYNRFFAGLGYEFSCAMYILNLYFFARMLHTKSNHDILVYCMTLFIVFSFHGGGALFLLPATLLILFNGVIFRNITWSLFKRGLFAIIVTAILGNLWMLAMFKYGILRDVGDALPILDELLGTKKQALIVKDTGKETLYLLVMEPLQYLMMALTLFMLPISYLSRRSKFIYSSMMLAAVSTFIVFYLPHLGVNRLVAYSRGLEYLLTAEIITLTFIFYYFFNKPLKAILRAYYARTMLVIFFIVLIVGGFAFPKWYNAKDLPPYVATTLYPQNVKSIGYSASAQTILDINKLYRPFSWTIVSYVQEYSRAKDKGYHFNVQEMIMKYNPRNKYLEIPTKYIFIIEEIRPNQYKGLDEWRYRWRREVMDNLRAWIAIYTETHDNIRLYKSTKNINVYLIENSEYMEELAKQDRINREK